MFYNDQENKSRKHMVGIKNNINLNKTVCLRVKAYPGYEPYATLKLRRLKYVLYAIRTGGEAGGYVVKLPQTDFTTKGSKELKKQNRLDNTKFTGSRANSLNSNYVKKR